MRYKEVGPMSSPLGLSLPPMRKEKGFPDIKREGNRHRAPEQPSCVACRGRVGRRRSSQGPGDGTARPRPSLNVVVGAGTCSAVCPQQGRPQGQRRESHQAPWPCVSPGTGAVVTIGAPPGAGRGSGRRTEMKLSHLKARWKSPKELI